METPRSGMVEPFGQRREHPCDLLGRGFQTVQRSVASSTERGTAGLTAKRLDRLSRAMLAISDEGKDVRIGDSEVQALLVRTGVALGLHSLGCSPAAFHLTPGAYWCRGRSHTGGGEATDGTIKRGSGLEKALDHRASTPYV